MFVFRFPTLRSVVGACSVLVLAACGGGDSPTAPSTVVTPPTVPVATPSTSFDMQLRFVGDGGTAALRESFARASTRWREVVVGDIGTTHLSSTAGECQDFLPAVNESINDLLVFVRIAKIDGPNKVVAQASPCYVNAETKLPIMGFFELDVDDVETLTSKGILDDVVLHELGHVLGIGTLWNYKRSLLVGSGSDDPYFTGAAARAAFLGIGGTIYSGNAVPVENTGASGTRDAHWRGSIFVNELMQGFAKPGGMPLSRVTVGSLGDLGYNVSYTKADAFSLLAALRVGGNDDVRTEAVMLGDDVARAPLYEVDRAGTRRLVRPPLK